MEAVKTVKNAVLISVATAFASFGAGWAGSQSYINTSGETRIEVRQGWMAVTTAHVALWSGVGGGMAALITFLLISSQRPQKETDALAAARLMRYLLDKGKISPLVMGEFIAATSGVDDGRN